MEFCELKKGNLLSVTKTVVAFLDKSAWSICYSATYVNNFGNSYALN